MRNFTEVQAILSAQKGQKYCFKHQARLAWGQRAKIACSTAAS